MFRQASIAPAPRPYGTARIHKSTYECVKEKASMDAAVKRTLKAVTVLEPNLVVKASERREETMVLAAMIMEIRPAAERGTPRSACMTGQPEPRRESGSPKLIKARYIMARSSEIMTIVYHKPPRLANDGE